MRKAKPKILSVRIETKVDDSPNTSYLGEYSNAPASDYAIDRRKRGDQEPTEYRYWNPANHVPPGKASSWEHVDDESVKTSLRQIGLRPKGDPGQGNEHTRTEAIRALDLAYIEQDYQRMESLNRGAWHYLGIIAKAEVQLTPEGPIQTIRSGGLWGIESDSGSEYLESVKQEELADLRRQLEEVGCGKRAIDHAYQDVTENDD